MSTTSSVRNDAQSAKSKSTDEGVRKLADAVIRLTKIVDQLAAEIEDLHNDLKRLD